PDPRRHRGRGRPGPQLRRHHDPRRLVALRPVRQRSPPAVPATPAAACRRDGGNRDTGAVCFPRRVAELLRAGLDLRDRHTAGQISTHGLAVARGRLENQLSDLIFPAKTNAANERLAQHLWNHRDALLTFLHQLGLDATNWRAKLAIRFGVILRKVWGG